MARQFARSFYHSKQWKQARDAYYRMAHGLCERCLDKGRYAKGEIVHHVEHLTPANITDPSVTLGFDNLQLVCRECHAELHPETHLPSNLPAPRVAFDEEGNVIPAEEA